jgi:hypothetical protein
MWTRIDRGRARSERPGIAAAVTVMLWAALCAACGGGGTPTTPSTSLTSSPALSACGNPPFKAGNWPPACYLQFGSTSVFSTPLPTDRAVLQRHSQPALTGPATTKPQNLGVDTAGAGPGEPVFYSQPTDPEFTLNCVNDDPSINRPDHICPIDAVILPGKLKVPAGAMPETNRSIVIGLPRDHDSHMIVIDQAGGWEYDLWQVQSTSSFQAIAPDGTVTKGLSPQGGKIDFSWGGRIRLNGDGTTVHRPLGDPVDDSNAAHWAESAARVRIEELNAGSINHALWLTIPCTSTAQSVFPADPVGKARPCGGGVTTELGEHPLGSRFYLDMAPADVDALQIPAWKKTILRALATHGGFVGDTGGTGWLFAVETEQGSMYSGLTNPNGQPYADPWWQFAQTNQWEPYQPPANAPAQLVGKLYAAGNDHFDYATQIWPKIRILDPCITPPSGAPCN